MKPSSRAAIYVRVSTDEQTTENQRPELEQLARGRGFEVIEVFEETMSAAKRRPVFERLLADAHKGRFDVLVIWAIDRFGRSMAGNLGDVMKLDRLGVRIVSARESWLELEGPTRGLLVAVFSWVAEQERRRLSERTIAGMARARAAGKHVGRPRAHVASGDGFLAKAFAKDGKSVRAIAKQFGSSKSATHRALKRPKRGTPPKGTQATETRGAAKVSRKGPLSP